MKKIISIILVLMMVLSFAACGNNPTEPVTNTDPETDLTDTVIDNTDEKDVTEETSDEAKDDVKENEKEEKPATEQPKPQEKPEEKPQPAPDVKPEPVPEPQASVAKTLLNDFKAQAASASSALSLAEKLVANPVIQFSGGAMAVEPGYLTGFDNAEITGFKEGAVFMPMIGTIPFVGYVFILEDGASTSDFIANLKSSANLRWNICTSADEMVAGNVGNKVFFVMSPLSFDEE